MVAADFTVHHKSVWARSVINTNTNAINFFHMKFSHYFKRNATLCIFASSMLCRASLAASLNWKGTYCMLEPGSEWHCHSSIPIKGQEQSVRVVFSTVMCKACDFQPKTRVAIIFHSNESAIGYNKHSHVSRDWKSVKQFNQQVVRSADLN